MDNYCSDLPLEEAVSPALRALQDYDKRHDTPYFETIRAYLLCERDIPKTSELLIIHRTTLLYRLKKINALVTLNLDNANQRMYLLLSLFIMDRGIPDDESGDSEEKAQPALQ